jgi:hypothetical protein
VEGSVIHQIEALRKMSLADLRREWERLYGEPSRSHNRDFLWRRLAWRIQELANGGLSGAARERIVELAPSSFTRARVPAGFQPPAADPVPLEELPRTVRDPRLPSPGTVISRRYHGRELRLLVLDDGYELDGVRYASLTEAARAATGAHWNGRLFWQVTERRRRQ